MKKILIASMALFSISSYAQLSEARYGVTGGLNYSRVRNAHNPSGPIYSFQVGALAEIPISDDDQFFIQPEIVYYGAGETGKDKDVYVKDGQSLDDVGYNAKYANHYISVPIYLKGFFSDAESEFFGLFGPRFNVLVGQSITKPAKPYYTVDGQTIDGVHVHGKASSFNMAISGGIGFSYKRQLEVTARVDYGLLNTYKGLMNEPGFDESINKSKKEHVISIGVNYIFD